MPLNISSATGDEIRAAEQQAGANPIAGMTLTQALAWIDANVTNLATAIVALKHVTRYLFVVERRLDEIEARLDALE